MPRRSADGLRYSSAAVRELRAQLEHYAGISPGLELDFAHAVRQAEALAVGNPEGFARVRDDADLRVIVIRRFPYRMIYTSHGGAVLVVAIAHTAMHPRQFFDRV